MSAQLIDDDWMDPPQPRAQPNRAGGGGARAWLRLPLPEMSAAQWSALCLTAGLILGLISSGGPAAAVRSVKQALAGAGLTPAHVVVEGAERADLSTLHELNRRQGAVFLGDVRLTSLRAELLSDPWVAEASVVRLWPDTIAARIDERKPLALWRRGGTIVVLSDRGDVVEGAQAREFGALPLLEGDGADRGAVHLLTHLSAAPSLSERMAAARLVGGRAWSILMHNGAEVLLPHDDLGAALAVLERLHRNHSVLDMGACRLDMREADRLAVRPCRADAEAGRPARGA